MKHRIAWLFAAALAVPARAQVPIIPPVKPPALVRSAETPEAFVPAGWVLEQKLLQDFNGDGKPDALLLMHMNEPRNVVTNEGLAESKLDTNPRLMAAVFAEPKGYRLSFQDMALIPRNDQPTMQDPFTSLALVKGGFDVNLRSFANAGSWWMGSTKFRFRYQEGCFRLIGYDNSSLHRASHESDSTSVNYLTGAVVHEHADDETAKPTVKRSKLAIHKPLCLEQVGDGLEFQAEP